VGASVASIFSWFRVEGKLEVEPSETYHFAFVDDPTTRPLLSPSAEKDASTYAKLVLIVSLEIAQRGIVVVGL
jgi:hypothetical protein